MSDYTEQSPGAKRFINVSGDSDRIMTCFLDYASEHVNVHDLLHEREAKSWKLSVSGYRKMRVSPAWVQGVLSDAGLCTLVEAGRGGMVRVIARRV